jgi:hypothetical protein
MRKLRTAVLAGAAALCVAGTAMAASNDSHVMTVSLPDGSVAQIEYRDEVAPKVRVDPTPGFAPVRFGGPFDAAPFAAFDRIFADMDREAAAMMRQVQALQVQAASPDAKPDLAAFAGMPAGTVSYSFVSTSDGKHVCSRSWQMTSQGVGQQPKLVSASSGDCDTASPTKAGGHAVVPARATTASPRADASTT